MRLGTLLFITLTFWFTSNAHSKQSEITLDKTKKTYTFLVDKGSYINAVVTAENKTDVSLIDQQSNPIRKVLDKNAKQARLHFIADYDHPKMIYSGSVPEIKINRIVSKAEQDNYIKQTDSKLINQAFSMLKSGVSTEDIWNKLIKNGSPLIEQVDDETLITFIYKGAKNNVLIFGAPASNHGWMERLQQSNIWYKSYKVPNTTRLSYKLAPDVPQFNAGSYEKRVALLATAQRDLNNPNYFPKNAKTKYEQKSVVELNDAPPQYPATLLDEVPTPPLSFELNSEILKNKRTIKVYRFGDVTKSDAIQLLMFDGLKYLEKINLNLKLNTLVKNGSLPPIEAIFIESLDSKTRGKELPSNADFTKMLTNELLPTIEKSSPVQFLAKQRVLAGSSYGGIGASTNAFRRSDIFGNVISLSGSYWWDPKNNKSLTTYYFSEKIMNSKTLPIRFFISAGLFEGARNGQKGILDGSRYLRDILKVKGYDVSYREYAGGHDYLVWQGTLIDGLFALFPVH